MFGGPSTVLKACQNPAKKFKLRSLNDFVDRLDSADVQPDSATYARFLRQCGVENALSHGKRIHNHIVKRDFDQNTFLGNVLVLMYGNCGALEDACALFVEMSQRDLFSWNFMIKAYIQNGQAQAALEIIEQMKHEGVIADKHIFTSILFACATQSALAMGKELHTCILEHGFKLDISVVTALVNMYSNCNSLEDAKNVLDTVNEQNVVSLTAMMVAYTQHGQFKNATEVFDLMLGEGVMPDKITFVSILDTYTNMASLAYGKQMHACLIGSDFESDVLVGTALLNMYTKTGNIQDAKTIFEKITERNVVSWNAMISGYAQNGQGKDALQLFERMQRERVLPSKITFVSILDACAGMSDLFEGKNVHKCMVESGFESGVEVKTALVNVYGKCGSLEDARNIFDKMCDRILISWNALIAAYAQEGNSIDALHLCEQMRAEGVMPNAITFVSTFPACASQAAVAEVERIHARIESSEFESDVLVNNALLCTYAKCGHVESALRRLDEMTKLDKTTFVSILSVCASQVAVAKGRQIHARIANFGLESDVVVGTALVNMYSKCGSLHDAQTVFDEMPERNLVSWSALIAAYSQHGRGKDALQVFDQMQRAGIMPNKVTFVNLLSACSHSGLLSEAGQCFGSMSQVPSITPNLDHYNCMVDVLGRAGRLQEAESLIYDMPFMPTSVSWMTLLGACRTLVNVEQGEHAAELVFKLDPQNTAPYSMLLNIYSLAGREEDAARVLGRMKSKGLKEPSRPQFHRGKEYCA